MLSELRSLLFVGLAACVAQPYENRPQQNRSAPRIDDAGQVEARAGAKPLFVTPASATDSVAALVRRHRPEADAGPLVVYVGAAWCEPCQRFHEAVVRGDLDDELAGVRFLEFDADVDGSRLAEGGYGGRLIPRFVVPDAGGRASDKRIEGGIKGDGAVAHILGRLRELLGRRGG